MFLHVSQFLHASCFLQRRLVQKENERRNQANYGQNQKIKRSIAK